MDTSFQHPVAISQVMVNFAARYGVAAQTCLLGTGISEAQCGTRMPWLHPSRKCG
ncbi:hypothetical protein [Pseudomonas sp.]|uniref:hypothetical protein n=1 Tax=Pseudomonas sp. TaxID=306 RepID=UPI002B7A733A|nr:hypothetical protein [Pseudomonas sp.]HUE90507.1 hypothetical protein [Pseudomonas sp.]